MIADKNNNKSIKNLQFIMDAMKLITSRDVQYHSINNHIYFVCKNIKILVEDDSYTIEDGYKCVVIYDIKHLLLSVLVEATEIEGLSNFKKRSLELNQLRQSEKEHISMLSSFIAKDITPELLYEKILFAKGSAREVGNLLNISPGFIKSIRAKNRKAIIISIICEALSESSQFVA